MVCPAAPQIGCGSKSKPVLLELEENKDVAEAWLNRQGTVIAVVWKSKNNSIDRFTAINNVFDKNNMHPEKIIGKEYNVLAEEFNSKKDWFRGTTVDRLSEEEAVTIAERLVERISSRTISNR